MIALDDLPATFVGTSLRLGSSGFDADPMRFSDFSQSDDDVRFAIGHDGGPPLDRDGPSIGVIR